MLSFTREVFAFVLERKKYWLLPLMLITASLGGLLALTQGSAIAPFIYALF